MFRYDFRLSSIGYQALSYSHRYCNQDESGLLHALVQLFNLLLNIQLIQLVIGLLWKSQHRPIYLSLKLIFLHRFNCFLL